MVNFSAQTTVSQTQGIIDGKLDKRRKGVFGPRSGKRAIVFVDDFNMPQVEEYGAQPPIEILRQFLCDTGWYDIEGDKSWRSIVNTQLLAAMGPPGGGRNEITPRIMRHFNLVCLVDSDNETLESIFFP